MTEESSAALWMGASPSQKGDPRTLYVIGNGFDLWHGIPSLFSHFKQFVKERDLRVLRDVEDYLPVRENWSDLESALAGMDVDSLIDNLGPFMASYGADDWSDASHHDFQYEVGQVVSRLSRGLRQRFGEWVRQLPIPTSNTAPRRLTRLDPASIFLNFNYTSTLSKLYGVPAERILYIHGCAAVPDQTLVLGHAWRPQDRKSLNDRPDIEDVDTRLAEANGIIDGYFGETFKRSDDLIARHRDFFEGLTKIEQVVVLGHSLSSVDAAYFKALLDRPEVAAANWIIACRSLDEWPERQSLLGQLGLETRRATPVLWDAL
jgi:hypothetical protein